MTPRRVRIATTVLAAALLALAAGWWVRAPAIEHHAVAPPPDIDIDPPAMRARRDAAFALATMPDDPWTLAETLATSAPDKAVEKEHCGIEDGPQFSKPTATEEAPVQTTGAAPRYLAAQARMDAALRTSADPLDRAVADLVNVGDMRSGAGAYEAVVQQAAGTTDPRLFALGFVLCRHEAFAACMGFTLDRWTEVDPGNGVPLVWALSQARSRGDAAGMRTAMARLASATRFDVRFGSIPGAVASRVPKEEPDLAAVSDLVVKATGIAAAMPYPEFQALIQACRDHAGGDAERARQCQAIGDVMYERSDSLLVQSLSGVLQFQMTGDASRRDVIRAEREVATARWSPATGLSECREMRDLVKHLLRQAQVGEVEALHEQARKFVTP